MSVRSTSLGRLNYPEIIWAAAGIGMVVFVLTYQECDAVCADWDYASDLLLEDWEINRWDRGPLVGVRGGDRGEVEMVEGAVYELNQILHETPMWLHFVGDDRADITVRFVPRDEFDRLRRVHDLDERILGFCSPSIGAKGQISAARIYIATDQGQGQIWGTVLHELGHAMGLLGHTDRYLSSLFYEGWTGGALSDGFSSDDRKLLQFLYRHLDPGARERTVRAAFDRHWVLRDS